MLRLMTQLVRLLENKGDGVNEALCAVKLLLPLKREPGARACRGVSNQHDPKKPRFGRRANRSETPYVVSYNDLRGLCHWPWGWARARPTPTQHAAPTRAVPTKTAPDSTTRLRAWTAPKNRAVDLSQTVPLVCRVGHQLPADVGGLDAQGFSPAEMMADGNHQPGSGEGALDPRRGMNLQLSRGDQLSGEPAFDDRVADQHVGVEGVAFFFDHEHPAGPDVLRHRPRDAIVAHVHVATAALAHGGGGGHRHLPVRFRTGNSEPASARGRAWEAPGAG